MKKTTLYLPDDLKEAVKFKARKEKRSEADVIREAIAKDVMKPKPERRLKLGSIRLPRTNILELMDEVMEDFGKD